MMNGLRIRRSIVVLALAGALLGCNPFRRKPPKLSPPPAPIPQPAQIETKTAPPEPLPSPPRVSETPVEVPGAAVQVPPPPPPPRVKAKGRRRKPSPLPPAEAAATPDPQPVAPAPPAAPPLQLGTVLSPEKRAEYTRAVDQSLARAEADVAPLKGKSLNSDQSAALNRILSYISQARENRNSDPALAARLAERAELLARDLAGSVR